MPISHGSRRALERVDKEIPIKLLPAKCVSNSSKSHKHFKKKQIVMEEVHPTGGCGIFSSAGDNYHLFTMSRSEMHY